MGERSSHLQLRWCLPIKVETWDKLGEAQCLDNLGLAHYSAGELRLAAVLRPESSYLEDRKVQSEGLHVDRLKWFDDGTNVDALGRDSALQPTRTRS